MFARIESLYLVLSKNSFSNRLQPLGFSLYDMLVVDLLHEFELGVWKALFIHLLHILEAINPALLHELDRWYACSMGTTGLILMVI
jgi:hypothetical protein